MAERADPEREDGQTAHPARSAAPRWTRGDTVLALVFVAALVAPMVFQKRLHLHTNCGGASKAKSDIFAIAGAVREYAAQNHGQLPSALELLLLPDQNGDPYLDLESEPLDPWKRPYRYELCVAPPGFRVSSLGADGVPGGEGEDGDLDNLALEEGRL